MEEINKTIEIDYIENKTYDEQGNIKNYERTQYKTEPDKKTTMDMIQIFTELIVILLTITIICNTIVDLKKINDETERYKIEYTKNK